MKTTLHTSLKLFHLFRSAFGAYRLQIVGMTALSFISGVLEGIGINAVIPLLSFMGGGGGATDTISLTIAHFFRYLHLPYSVKSLLAFIVLLFLTKTVFLLVSQWVTARIMADFEKNSRNELLRLTFTAQWPFLAAQKVGHLDQMLTTEVSGASSILYYLSSVLIATANLVVYSILVFNLSSQVALFALISGTVIFLIFNPLLRITKAAASTLVDETKKLAHFASEHLIGAKVIKAMNLEERALERGASVLDTMRRVYMRLAFLKNVTGTTIQLVGILFIVGLFVFLYKTAAFQLASFAVVVYALNRIFSNIQSVQITLNTVSAQVPNLASLSRYFGAARAHHEATNGSEPFRFERNIAFSDLNFEYRQGEPALHQVSFSLKKGELLGLIGPSGAGKTTIVDLLLRLIEPKSGTIEIDGRDISTISLKEWRGNLGYVPQEVFLLNGTIEENIRFYDATLHEEDIVRAARAANILDFIESQPAKWETQVGERGLALSGGERQRIALARALASNPPILILDEATSALDHESEALIQKAILNLRGRTAVLIIAHRLSTVANADAIIVLEKGRVVEQGSPSALLRDEQSYFAKAHKTQT